MTRLTRTLAIATPLADRLALTAVQQQQRQGSPVTQRDLAAQAITALLDRIAQGHVPTWQPPERSTRPTRTLAIDSALADRLAVAAVQARAQAGHTVTMREVAEVAISQWLVSETEKMDAVD